MKLKAACCQMMVKESKQENLSAAEKMVEAAAKNGAELIVLPEMFQCPYENDAFIKYAERDGGKTTSFISDLANKNSCILVGGSIAEQENANIYNTSYIFSQNGNQIGKHRKLHLFDINIDGGIFFRESDTLTCGDSITVVDTVYGKMGVAICFDLRFPEQFISMAELGAKIIVIPAAFNTTTGPQHWSTLLKARALDSQSYIIACSPARNHFASYHAYGHSCIISPMGKLITEAGEASEIIYSEIDLDEVDKARAQLPVLSSRRKDLY